MSQPYIVTAALPRDIHAWADRLRQTHFPPERNHLHAHVTLFHAFAPSLFDELKSYLPRMAADHPPPAARIAGLMDLGKGTAIALASPAMLAIREQIAGHFHGSLTEQDLHEPRLHITIQNKVTREAAKELQTELSGTIPDREFAFPALELHLYRGPGWEPLGRWAFRG